MKNEMNNNIAEIEGVVIAKPQFSHEVYGEKFFDVKVASVRKSGAMDVIPTCISERLITDMYGLVGKRVRVNGNFRSFNKRENGTSKLILQLFVQEISFPEIAHDVNDIVLDGYICKESVFRVTPQGREITDLLLAVNRQYGKSDYIPCIHIL